MLVAEQIPSINHDHVFCLPMVLEEPSQTAGETADPHCKCQMLIWPSSSCNRKQHSQSCNNQHPSQRRCIWSWTCHMSLSRNSSASTNHMGCTGTPKVLPHSRHVLGAFCANIIGFLFCVSIYHAKLSQRDPNQEFLGGAILDPWLWIFCLGSLAWDLRFGIFGSGSLAWDLWLGSLGLGSLAWDLWLGIFGFGSLAWDLCLGIFGLWLGIFGFGSLACTFGLGSWALDLCLWSFGLGSLAWDLWAGILGLGDCDPEARGTGCRNWGDPPTWGGLPSH